MTLLESLLDAIARLNGEALVMHVGEKPYVVTMSSTPQEFRGPLAWGQVELSSRVLTADAVLGMLGQLLPAEVCEALAELGAVEHAVPALEGAAEHFSIVAARGGDDIWLEVRRHSPQAEPAQAEEAPAAETPQDAEAAHAPAPEESRPAPSDEPAVTIATEADEEEEEFEVSLDAARGTEEREPPGDRPFEIVEEPWQDTPSEAEVDELLAASASSLLAPPGAQGEPHAAAAPDLHIVASDEADTVAARDQASAPFDDAGSIPAPDARGIVLPLTRQPVRPEPPPPAAVPEFALDELLRIAGARGASTLYVVSKSQPMLRVDGDISALDLRSGPLTENDVTRLLLDLAPADARDAWQRGAVAEFVCDVADVGRVRCVTFRDHRGPGLIVRMIPPRAISVDQLGLTSEVQALCAQSDGLVLVTGPRASGKSTLMSAFVDLINRTRSDHVVTIESQIGFVHESRRSFVSQREVRGDSDAIVAAVRAALREDPDVLLVEDLRTMEIAAVALEAAESGRLVLGSLAAPSSVAALDRLLDLFAAERRKAAQSSIAGALRGIVAQVLLRRVRGGRIAAREVLLNTSAVAALIQDANTTQLSLAIESGRRQGMMLLNDTLVQLVRDGTVQVTEAYRKAVDREGLLAALKRDGVDTSFAERLA